MVINRRIENLLNTEGPLLAPSLLAADFTNLGAALAKVSKADALHLDIMDGHFVPNISYGPSIVKQLRPLWDKVFDVHLMVKNPEAWLEAFADAGADIFVFHLEATDHAHRLVQEIKKRGMLAGISLNPSTPASCLEAILPDLDLVLLMTVNPGFGGQSYIVSMEKKIAEVREMIYKTGKKILLQVDGGIKEETITGAAKAGADFFVAGTSVFKADNPEAEIKKLKERAQGVK